MWWNKREESEYAWRVAVEQIKASNYNLDIKNPHATAEEHGDLVELLAAHRQVLREVAETRDRLKSELLSALMATAGSV